MAYYCRYSLGGTLDFLHFLQKSFYNINLWSAFGSGPLAAPFDFLPQFGGIQFKERRTSEKERKKERERESEMILFCTSVLESDLLKMSFSSSQPHPPSFPHVLLCQCDQIGRYIGLWATF